MCITGAPLNRIHRGELGRLVHRTEHINNHPNPNWKQFTIESTKLNNNDDDLPLRFTVYDHNSNGSHDLIGQAQLSIAEIFASDQKIITLVNDKMKESGDLILNSLRIQKSYSFLEYIKSGLHR